MNTSELKPARLAEDTVTLVPRPAILGSDFVRGFVYGIVLMSVLSFLLNSVFVYLLTERTFL